MVIPALDLCRPVADATRAALQRSLLLAPMRSSRVPPPLWMLMFAVAMWALSKYWPVLTFIPTPWRRLGWFAIALALIPPIAAITQFRRAHTTPNPHRLETTTSLVRNVSMSLRHLVS